MVFQNKATQVHTPLGIRIQNAFRCGYPFGLYHSSGRFSFGLGTSCASICFNGCVFNSSFLKSWKMALVRFHFGSDFVGTSTKQGCFVHQVGWTSRSNCDAWERITITGVVWLFSIFHLCKNTQEYFFLCFSTFDTWQVMRGCLLSFSFSPQCLTGWWLQQAAASAAILWWFWTDWEKWTAGGNDELTCNL